MLMVEKICNFRGVLNSFKFQKTCLDIYDGKRPVISEVF